MITIIICGILGGIIFRLRGKRLDKYPYISSSEKLFHTVFGVISGLAIGLLIAFLGTLAVDTGYVVTKGTPLAPIAVNKSGKPIFAIAAKINGSLQYIYLENPVDDKPTADSGKEYSSFYSAHTSIVFEPQQAKGTLFVLDERIVNKIARKFFLDAFLRRKLELHIPEGSVTHNF